MRAEELLGSKASRFLELQSKHSFLINKFQTRIKALFSNVIKQNANRLRVIFFSLFMESFPRATLIYYHMTSENFSELFFKLNEANYAMVIFKFVGFQVIQLKLKNSFKTAFQRRFHFY
jgi:hypothetical protein